MAGGTYDFVVLGGGHNGLLTTAYLAKAGFKVCCLEANDEFGGGTRSQEIAPGYIADTGGMVHNMISKTPIVRGDELGLFSKYGLEYCYLDSLFCSIFPDDTNLVMTKDIDQSCQNIAKFSEKDAETYLEFNQYMTRMLSVAGIGSQAPPPPYGAMMNVMSMSPEGREFQRVLNSSAQQIVEEWFESEQGARHVHAVVHRDDDRPAHHRHGDAAVLHRGPARSREPRRAVPEGRLHQLRERPQGVLRGQRRRPVRERVGERDQRWRAARPRACAPRTATSSWRRTRW